MDTGRDVDDDYEYLFDVIVDVIIANQRAGSMDIMQGVIRRFLNDRLASAIQDADRAAWYKTNPRFPIFAWVDEAPEYLNRMMHEGSTPPGTKLAQFARAAAVTPPWIDERGVTVLEYCRATGTQGAFVFLRALLTDTILHAPKSSDQGVAYLMRLVIPTFAKNVLGAEIVLRAFEIWRSDNGHVPFSTEHVHAASLGPSAEAYNHGDGDRRLLAFEALLDSWTYLPCEAAIGQWLLETHWNYAWDACNLDDDDLTEGERDYRRILENPRQSKTVAAGHCYDWAYRKVFYNWPEAILVHGTVEDPWDHHNYVHAWVERDGCVYDWQSDARGQEPRSVANFYATFKPSQVTRYTREQAVLAMLRAQHYGPWT